MRDLIGLRVGNFKAFGPTQKIPIRPITLIFGPNSGGKSSIIHSLALLNSGLESRGPFGWDIHKTRLGGDTIDLGGFRNYQHRPSNNESVVIGAEYLFRDVPEGTVDQQGSTQGTTSIALEIGSFLLARSEKRFEQFGIRRINVADTSGASLWLVRHPLEGPEALAGAEGIVFRLAEHNTESELWQRSLRKAGDWLMSHFTLKLAPYFWDGNSETSGLDDSGISEWDWSGYVSKILAETEWEYFFGFMGDSFKYIKDYPENILSQRVETIPDELSALDLKLRKASDELRAMPNPIGDAGRQELRVKKQRVRRLEKKIASLKAQRDLQEEKARWKWEYADRSEADDFENWMERMHAGEAVPYWFEKSEYLQDSVFRRSVALDFGTYLADEFNKNFRPLKDTFAPEVDYQLAMALPERAGPRVIYLGPLRTYPDRHLFESDSHKFGDDRAGHQEWMSLFGEEDRLKELNIYLGADFLDSGYQIGIQEYIKAGSTFMPPDPSGHATESGSETKSGNVREIKIYNATTGIELSNRDIGVGMSQVLPVLISLSTNLNRGKLIAVEQPELHLHPAMQARLGDIFIKSVMRPLPGSQREFSQADETTTSTDEVSGLREVDGSRFQPFEPNKLVVETHSEHLILRILRRIRQTSEGTLPEHLPGIRPEDVAVLYVKPEAGGARVIHIPINAQGEFEEPWPGGFFPERLDELLD